MTEQKFQNFSIRMSDEEMRVLDDLAKSLGVKRGWLVKRLIQRARRENELKQLAKELGFNSLVDEKP